MNDYTLLREVDWSSVRPGDKLIDRTHTNLDTAYVAGPDKANEVCVRYGADYLGMSRTTYLRLAPLTWLAGKPVYPGDTVFHKLYGAVLVDAGHPLDLSACSWEPPKTKRKGWINLYRCPEPGFTPAPSTWVVLTREAADDLAQRTSSERLACVEVEWEE